MRLGEKRGTRENKARSQATASEIFERLEVSWISVVV